MLGDPLPLAGVPEGCVARPVLVEDHNGGERLPRDRSGRVKLTTVELTAVIDSHPTALPAGADPRLGLFFALCQFPLYLSPFLLRPLYRRLMARPVSA